MKKNVLTCITAFAALIFVLSCGRFTSLTKSNLLEGDNAAKAAAAVKDKVGGPVNVIRVELRTDEMEITIQSPKNPKDIDKYTYKNGMVTGPEPVQVISMGQLEMTGDKYGTTPIDEIGWTNVPATIKRAIELSKLENAKVDLISMDNQNIENGTPNIKEDREKKRDELKKDIDERRKACSKDVSTMAECWKGLKPDEDKLRELTFGNSLGKAKLVLTWRLFVEGPRGRKDFWADMNGKLNEQSF